MDTREIREGRRTAAELWQAGQYDRSRRERLILADLLADEDQPERAERERRRAVSRRSPGCRWPRAGLIEDVSEHQRDALRRALSRPVGILTGTPGVGKTRTAAAVIREVANLYGSWRIAVCAPTGKAAVRLHAALQANEIAGIRPTTIHTLLEIGRNGHDGEGWGFQRDARTPLDQQFVIVDEASMVDTNLLSHLLRACRDGTHVLFVGDPYQLPPVGHGAPLRDMLAAGIPCGMLTEIWRNAGAIVHGCASIKDGKAFTVSPGDRIGVYEYPLSPETNLAHIECATAEQQIERLLDLLDHRVTALGLNPVWDCQVLTAVNGNSPISRKAVNLVLQAHLNPTGATAEGNPFRFQDKLICLKNQWCQLANSQGDVYLANGEIGVVLAVEPGTTFARFEDPRRDIRIPMARARESDGESVDADAGTGADFDLAYAITCHKSQGSEFPCVIILADGSPGAVRVCSREWLYTAVSRATRLCVTIGKKGVLDMMPRRPALQKRKTFLAELLGTIV
jgi:exodeoxyribonuclease-5/exodeoxyribonuclease V alpha subunit